MSSVESPSLMLRVSFETTSKPSLGRAVRRCITPQATRTRAWVAQFDYVEPLNPSQR